MKIIVQVKKMRLGLKLKGKVGRDTRKRHIGGKTFRTCWMWDEKERESMMNLGLGGLTLKSPGVMMSPSK